MRLVQFNVENLFINLEKKSLNQDPLKMTEKEWQACNVSIYENKPLQKVKTLAKVITQLNPDILGLCEVGGVDSLENFNLYFLNNEFEPKLIEGNSDRGIDVGFLIKKSFSGRTELKSHRERSFRNSLGHEVYFARDVAELRVTNAQGQLSCIVLLVHLKSKWDREGDDPQGSYRREAEFKELLQISRELQESVGAQVPIILTGDFNGIVVGLEQEPEFSQINEASFADVFETSNVDLSNRYTQVQVMPYAAPKKLQLDFTLISKAHENLIKQSFVFRFQDEFGMELPSPTNMTAKSELPSDHYPVVADFDLE